jgi:adenylate cyclase class 2
MWSTWLIVVVIVLISVALLIAMRAPRVVTGGAALEVEKAYFTFDEAEVRKKLAAAGATHAGLNLFRLNQYVPPEGVKSVRVRDEGHRVTMTVKKKTDTSFDMESEVTINSFDGGVDVLNALGLRKKYYLEKLRDIYKVGDAEVVFDTYPGLPPYIEVEGPDEARVDSVAASLGLSPNDPQDKGAGEMYAELYGITKDRPLSDLTFSGVAGSLGPLVTKDPEQFAARVEEHTKVADGLRSRAH